MTTPEPTPAPRDGLAAHLEALERILEMQLAGHQELRGCLAEKRESLRRADLESIASLCQKENGIARRLGDAEQKRVELIRRLTVMVEPGAETPLTLRRIVERSAPGPGGAALLELAERLREEVHTVRRESSIVTAAAEALRKHVTGIMQSVNRAVSRVGTYERRGQIAVGSQMDFCVDLTS